MTERVSHLVVTLAEPERVDDIKALIAAIRLMKNVADVRLGEAASAEFIARHQLRSALQLKLYDVIDKFFDPK